jgi:hypothetical protein
MVETALANSDAEQRLHLLTRPLPASASFNKRLAISSKPRFNDGLPSLNGLK